MSFLPLIKSQSVHQRAEQLNIKKMRHSESKPNRIGDVKNKLRRSLTSILKPNDKNEIKDDKNDPHHQKKLVETKRRPLQSQSLLQGPKQRSYLRINEQELWRPLNICMLLNESQSYEHQLTLWKHNIFQRSFPSPSKFNKIVILDHFSRQVHQFEFLTNMTLKIALQQINSYLKNMKGSSGKWLYSGTVFEDGRVVNAFFWTTKPFHYTNLSEVLNEVAKQLQFFLHPNLEKDHNCKICINNVWGTTSYIQLINLKPIILLIRQEVRLIQQKRTNILDNSKKINKIWNNQSSQKQQRKLLKL